MTVIRIPGTSMPSRNDQLAAIRAAAIKANPEIKDSISSIKSGADLESSVTVTIDRPIRLADVLLAAAQSNRVFDLIALEIIRLWNLPRDDITLQSDPCVAFLADLLK